MISICFTNYITNSFVNLYTSVCNKRFIFVLRQLRNKQCFSFLCNNVYYTSIYLNFLSGLILKVNHYVSKKRITGLAFLNIYLDVMVKPINSGEIYFYNSFVTDKLQIYVLTFITFRFC